MLLCFAGEENRALLWGAALRAERLKTQGRENLFSADDISALKTLERYGHILYFSKTIFLISEIKQLA